MDTPSASGGRVEGDVRAVLLAVADKGDLDGGPGGLLPRCRRELAPGVDRPADFEAVCPSSNPGL